MDKIILSELRSNARIKLSDMSRKFKVPITTLHYRLSFLKPVVSKFTSLTNFELLGLKRTIVVLTISDYSKIKSYNNVNNAFFAGDFVVVEFIGKTRLPEDAYSAEVIKVLKQEEFRIK